MPPSFWQFPLEHAARSRGLGHLQLRGLLESNVKVPAQIPTQHNHVLEPNIQYSQQELETKRELDIETQTYEASETPNGYRGYRLIFNIANITRSILDKRLDGLEQHTGW